MKKWLAATLCICLATLLAGCGTAVPDTKGMAVRQATKSIESAGFKVGEVNFDEKASGTVGTVSGQEPQGGKVAKKGTLVILTIAGPPPVAIPDLSGLDKDKAAAALVASGLKLGDVGESYDTSVPAGVVASQTPVARAEAPRGSAVMLVISKGPQPVAVPDTKGRTREDATKLLEAAGFKVKVETKPDDAKKDTVIAQSPKGGEARPGSKVTITVSSGVSYVRAPDFCALAGGIDFGLGDEAAVFTSPRHYGDPKRLDAYRKIAKTAGVEVRFVYSDPGFEHGMNSWPHGQSPPPGTRVKRGSTVRLIIFE